jgi:uncharacterized protein (DUF1800 family)
MSAAGGAIPKDPWAPYAPSREEPWDVRRVVHLHRRAGFAATWKEVQRDLEDGPRASIDRLLKGKARAEGVPETFKTFSDTLARLAVEGGDAGRLKAWWVYRMLLGPDPLSERLTLMWHNHFATNQEKVRNVGAMRAQNETLRAHARAPFGKMLGAMVRDPALLVWLDAQVNVKGRPNENLARELMELFTLGVGNYTERDVKEAARALTGWGVREEPAKHDGGEKEVLGRKGRWKAPDLVKILLAQPATAGRLAFRVGELFLGEGAVSPGALKPLAAGLAKRELDVGWAVETVLRSRAFFAEANLGTKVLDPAGFVIGAARALELFDPAPNTLILAEAIGNLGQDLFYPPNVGGWPGGRAWLSTRSVIGRHNYAVSLLGGADVGLPAPVDALALARRHGRAGSLEGALTFHAELLLGALPGRAWRDRLLGALGPRRALEARAMRNAVALILSTPEAQLS